MKLFFLVPQSHKGDLLCTSDMHSLDEIKFNEVVLVLGLQDGVAQVGMFIRRLM